MEWTIVTVIIALVGLFLAVGKPILGLNSSVTKLQLSVDKLESYQKTQDEQIKLHNTKLEDHEHRITVLEIARKQEERE